MTNDWTHPVKLNREELEELVVKELMRRNMSVKGPVRFLVAGNPPQLEGAEAAVAVRPVSPAESSE
jgi:hypothetical protein